MAAGVTVQQTANMNPFKTSATVADHGEVRIAGVPFEPGTQVTVTLTPAKNGAQSHESARDRMARLFAALDKSRNTESVGPLNRSELYDRNVVH